MVDLTEASQDQIKEILERKGIKEISRIKYLSRIMIIKELIHSPWQYEISWISEDPINIKDVMHHRAEPIYFTYEVRLN